MNCEEARSEMAAVALGQADPPAGNALQAHAAACAACGAEYAAVSRTISLARSAGGAPFDLPAGLRDRVLAAAGEKAPPENRRSFVERARLWGAMAGLAACVGLVLTAAALTVYGGRRGDEASARMVFGGAAVISSPGGGESLLSDPLAAGHVVIRLPARLRAAGAARFDLQGGVCVACRGATLVLGRSGVVLDEGVVAVTVPPGTPFRVQTPGALTEVAGTAFTVEAAGGKTMVSVERGSVRLSSGAASSELKQGQSAIAAGGVVSPAQFPPDPALSALAQSRDLHLEAKVDRSTVPPSIEVLLHNISSSPIVVPAQGADRPRFSLKFRSASTGFEGVARLPDSPARVLGPRGEAEPANGSPAIRLEPSEAMRLRFEISSILSEPGEYQVWGVYQSTPPAAHGAWIGQAVSGPIAVEIGRK